MTAPPGYTEIDPGLFRGPRPTWGILSSFDPPLATVIDLEPVRIEAGEESIARKLGVRELPIPMSSVWPPNLGDVQWAAATMIAPQNRPCLIHCKHGKSRTGVVCAYWRVRYCLWTQADAYQEMMAMHFEKWRYLYWKPTIERFLNVAVSER
jgi:hypothetical protein